MKNRKKTVLSAQILVVATVILAVTGAPRARGQMTGPAVTLSTNILNFPPQLVTTTSAPQTVTLTNSGSADLIISSIVLAGLFSQTNTCPAPATLPPGASCTFTVTFQPATGGATAGLITITDNALPLGVQAISLGGTGEDFGLTVSPSSATVAAGGTATFTMTVSPSGGFNQAVTSSCSGLPAGASCSFSPNPVTPDGTNPATVTITVSTTARALTSPSVGPRTGAPLGSTHLPVLWLWVFLTGLAGFLAVGRRRPSMAPNMRTLALLMLVSAALAIVACGGGGSGSGSGGSSGTPAGTYSVLVTGSTPAGSGTLQNPAKMTLVVQ